jgi:hypothetical protein
VQHVLSDPEALHNLGHRAITALFDQPNCLRLELITVALPLHALLGHSWTLYREDDLLAGVH